MRYYGKLNHDASSYIAHHGVKGQKHGIRRWQNLDGSLTHHFYQEIDDMIQDHLLASKGLSFGQVYDENRAITEAAAFSIAGKTIGDIQEWGFIEYMCDKIREQADERIWN